MVGVEPAIAKADGSTRRAPRAGILGPMLRRRPFRNPFVRRSPAIAAALTSILFGTPAFAQDGTDDAIERRIDRLERSARDFAPAKPSSAADVQVAGPGAEQTSGVARDPMSGVRGGELREGASVIDVRGRVAHTPGGWVFAADPVDAPSDSPRVLLRLLPSPTSEELRATVRAREQAGDPPATFRLSGRVLVDRGRVYLLPLFATMLEPETTEETSPVGDDERPVDVEGDETSPDDPSVRDLIERIERASDAERAGVREEFVGAAGGSTPGVRMIVGRVARLSRDPDGKLVFAIERGVRESDGAEGPGGVDRLAVLPCRLYPALEGLWASRGDGARLLVSGEAFRDDGRWYLLPSLVETERTSPSGLRTLR